MTDTRKCYGTLRDWCDGEPSRPCPLRDKCWRYLAPRGEFGQSFIAARYDKVTGKCIHYLDLGLTDVTNCGYCPMPDNCADVERIPQCKRCYHNPDPDLTDDVDLDDEESE